MKKRVRTANCLNATGCTPAYETYKTAQRNGRWDRGKHVETAWIGIQCADRDSCTIQEQIGHSDAKTAVVYTHVLNRGGLGVQNPIDRG